MNSPDPSSERIRQLEAENLALRHALAGKISPERRDEFKNGQQPRERTLRTILDRIPAMVGYWNRDLRNIFCNHAYAEWFGVDPDKMRGKHIREVIGDERYQLNLPYIDGALRGEPQEFERAIPSHDNTRIRHALANYIPDFENGEVSGFFALVTDISAIKEAETSLRTIEQRYRAVVEDQTEVIARFRRDGTLVFVNEIFCRLFGKSAEELLGQSWAPVCVAEDLPYIHAQLARLSLENPVINIENRIYSGTGEIRWMHFVNRGFFDVGGNLIEIQSVGRDISERKKGEAALHDAHQQLEQQVVERTRQLHRLVMDITLTEERERQALARDLHDGLGQLLHVLRIKIDSLETNLLPTALSSLEDIQALLTECSRLVRSITTQLSPPVLKKLGLVAALYWLCEEMKRQYGLLVEFIHEEGWALSDPTTSEILFRAARELLVNVVRHSGTLQARLVLSQDNERLLLCVEDEGAGIDDPLNAPLQTDGFGLASIRERITYLGGSAKIARGPSGGLHVCLHLPLTSLTSSPGSS